MTFIAVVAWGANFRLSKYRNYPTEQEAVAHAARVQLRFPGAFSTPRPGAGPDSWVVDPVAKTLSVVPRPAPPDTRGKELDAAFMTDALQGLLEEVAALRGVPTAQIIRDIKGRRGI